MVTVAKGDGGAALLSTYEQSEYNNAPDPGENRRPLAIAAVGGLAAIALAGLSFLALSNADNDSDQATTRADDALASAGITASTDLPADADAAAPALPYPQQDRPDLFVEIDQTADPEDDAQLVKDGTTSTTEAGSSSTTVVDGSSTTATTEAGATTTAADGRTTTTDTETTQAPGTTEAPGTTDAPGTSEARATTEAPATTQAPATTRPPTTQATTTTAAPTTTSPPTTSGGGGNCNSNGEFERVFRDDFNGSSVNTGNWSLYDSPGNRGFGLRRPSAISVSNGKLIITAKMENGSLVSGGMSLKRDMPYGKYVFRVRTDNDPDRATSGVILTWPQAGNNHRNGENNMYETLAKTTNRNPFFTFIHKPFGNASTQEHYRHDADGAQFQVMSMEWTPSRITITRQGPGSSSSDSWTVNETGADLIPDVPHHLAIQLDGWKHSMSSTVRMEVDYVEVYKYCG